MFLADVSVLTKTYVTFGLVLLALFEFFSAMYMFGIKGPKRFGKVSLKAHRIVGYVFLAYWIWPMIVGLGLLERLSGARAGQIEGLKWHFDGWRFHHAFLGVTVFLLLLLKVSFVRLFPAYRQQARTLGIAITLLAIATWIVSGLFWLAMMGGPVLER